MQIKCINIHFILSYVAYVDSVLNDSFKSLSTRYNLCIVRQKLDRYTLKDIQPLIVPVI